MHSSDQGALVISLDFELHWGLRDILGPGGAYSPSLLGVREAIPAMLRVFEHFGVSATWATVGMLFGQSRDEVKHHWPTIKPKYRNSALDSYAEPVGKNESEDRYHFGSDLLALIRQTPGQEIGSHTFSHFYCREEGQTAEAFDADLKSAQAIAATKGLALESIVFPRNQHNEIYDQILVRNGFSCYRGNPTSWMFRAEPGDERRYWKRVARLVDTYVGFGGSRTVSWKQIAETGRPYNIPASLFLRPWSPRLARIEGIRLRRIESALREAAADNRVVHLWWHPHNFGVNTAQNIAFLEQILVCYKRLARTHGLQSMTMAQAAETAATL